MQKRGWARKRGGVLRKEERRMVAEMGESSRKEGNGLEE